MRSTVHIKKRNPCARSKFLQVIHQVSPATVRCVATPINKQRNSSPKNCHGARLPESANRVRAAGSNKKGRAITRHAQANAHLIRGRLVVRLIVTKDREKKGSTENNNLVKGH
jgi:hypothetical protein